MGDPELRQENGRRQRMVEVESPLNTQTRNHFRIKTSLPNVEVSWQLTGICQDAYANRYRIAVEEDKPESERGSYLHPEAFDQPLKKARNAAFQQN
jgi:hypothetical protein